MLDTEEECSSRFGWFAASDEGPSHWNPPPLDNLYSAIKRERVCYLHQTTCIKPLLYH